MTKVLNLDNDFIILWSNYLLSGKMDMNVLTRLAELGQINAVQNYYLFSSQKNQKIDKIIDDYSKNQTPDGDYAKLNKYYYYNRKEIDEKSSNFALEYSRLISKRRDGLLFDEHLESQIHELEEKIRNETYTKSKRDCANSFWNSGIAINNPSQCEMAVEIQRSVPLHNSTDLKDCVNQVRKDLISNYVVDRENNQIKFSLAKNLIYFTSSRKEKALANQFLQELASQPYSNEIRSFLNNLEAERNM